MSPQNGKVSVGHWHDFSTPVTLSAEQAGAALHIAENLGELAECWREEIAKNGVGER